ncbi:MAG: hydroxymethylglutaryl-CoA lyase [Myxococcota bacterium]
MTNEVRITEVGPRDGLQNERAAISTRTKVRFVEALVEAGARQIEVTSFVHPKRVPALADAETVYSTVGKQAGVRYVALTPNRRGYERALSAGCDAVAVFTAASEGFTRANIGMTIPESLEHFRAIARHASEDGVAVRGYVSTAFECPYDGPVAPETVAEVAEALLEMECYEVSIGDTIGVATPADVRRLLDVLLARLPADRVCLHLHDTWGMAAAGAMTALDYGIRRFDASAGGLGGCPYAPGATGNAATEDLIYLFESLGYDTGMDIEAVATAADEIGRSVDHPLPSRVHQALIARRNREGPTC